MTLTAFEKTIFSKVENCVMGQWYCVADFPKDGGKLVAALKKRIDIYYDFEFSANYTHFKRILTLSQAIDTNYINPSVIAAVVAHHERILSEIKLRPEVVEAIEANKQSYRKY